MRLIFLLSANIASSTPSVDLQTAIATAEWQLSGTHNGITPAIEYLAKADGSVALTHVIQIQNEESGAWYEAFVDAHSNELLSVTDFVAEAAVSSIHILTFCLMIELPIVHRPSHYQGNSPRRSRDSYRPRGPPFFPSRMAQRRYHQHHYHCVRPCLQTSCFDVSFNTSLSTVETTSLLSNHLKQLSPRNLAMASSSTTRTM